MCLQEVDHYDDFYKQQFNNLGYDSFYTQKIRKDYGNVIAWKRNEFSKVSEEAIYPEKFIPTYFKDSTFYQQQGTNVQFLVLSKNSQEYLICNNHPNYRYETVKYFEVASTLHHLHTNYSQFINQNIIMCGDFNITPLQSAIKLISNPKEKFSKPQEDPIKMEEIFNHFVLPCQEKLPSLRSAYFTEDKGHPEFTNYTWFFKGNLDYIFYNSNSLKLLKIFKLNTLKEMKGISSFPDSQQPSDHIPLFAEFSII